MSGEARSQANYKKRRPNAIAGEVKSDFIFAKCKICKRRVCVNNYADRQIRPPRKLGVVVCPWCSWEAAYVYCIARDLAKATDKKSIKALQKKARKFFAEGADQNHIARRGAS